jgi:hypothetical protein
MGRCKTMKIISSLLKKTTKKENQNNISLYSSYNTEINILKQTIKEDTVFNQVKNYVKLFSEKWWGAYKGFLDFQDIQDKKSYHQKRIGEKELDNFIKKFIIMIKSYPILEIEREIWKTKLQNLIDEFITKSNLIRTNDKDILLGSGILENTLEFVKMAKEINTAITLEEIGQALRNLWIMNIAQLLLNKEVKLTSSIFGYSMLYPYTDNYLDDTDISFEEKMKISRRLEKKLKGEKIEAEDSYEDKIFRLVDKIEEEFDRSKYPKVFESLLCIHEGQNKSLIYQESASGPYEIDILGISIEKGGTSVLADAYLVNGTLSFDEAAFFFGYGVLLQICDDLQDVRVDYENNHMTIASQLSKCWPLDKITNGLINFTMELLDEIECFEGRNIHDLKMLIKKNCIMLILFAVAKNKKLYSKKYFLNIKKSFPFTVKYMVNLSKSLKKKFSKLEKSYAGSSVEDIIVYGLSTKNNK